MLLPDFTKVNVFFIDGTIRGKGIIERMRGK